MDQIGALLGPLLVAAMLFRRDGYATAFGGLLLPALLTLGVLVLARWLYPDPRDFEIGTPPLETQGFPRVFWLYLGAIGLIAAGYADFPLIAYHLQKTSLASEGWIPLFYAVAMGVDAVAALVCGRLFDRRGFAVLGSVTLVSLLFAPLVFLGNFHIAMLGMVLWGIGMGAQESIMRAAVAGMVPTARRGTAYGVFNSGYGLLWFAGSALMGVLYDVSLPALIAFSVVAQLIAVPVLFLVGRRQEAS
jgi:predicted MFS family arabinose efflux permease